MPHHNLVKDVRIKFLQEIVTHRLITRHIILIGPDHFSSDQHQITTADIDWHLSTGDIKFANLIKLNVDNPRLQNDHAIYNPLADIKTFFPHADVQPILIGQKVTSDQLQPLLKSLNQSCHFDCLLVFSVDFSHYLPASLSEVHDAYTLTQLQNLASPKILQAEVDSPQSLYIFTKYAQSHFAYHWQLFAHTNSGVIAHNPDSETTTHIFGSYSFGLFTQSTTQTSTSTPAILDRFYGVNKLTLDSLSNFSISTVTTPTQIIKSFLPIKNDLFVRGPDKQLLIKQYFDSIPTDPKLTKDYFWGKLIYER